MEDHPEALAHLFCVQIPLQVGSLLWDIFAPLQQQVKVCLVVVVVDQFPHGEIGQLVYEVVRLRLVQEHREVDVVVAGRHRDALGHEDIVALLYRGDVRPPQEFLLFATQDVGVEREMVHGQVHPSLEFNAVVNFLTLDSVFTNINMSTIAI